MRADARHVSDCTPERKPACQGPGRSEFFPFGLLLGPVVLRGATSRLCIRTVDPRRLAGSAWSSSGGP